MANSGTSNLLCQRITFYLHHCFTALILPITILITILLHGCVSTRYTGTTHCPPYLANGDKVLVNALPSVNWAYQIDLIRKELKGRNIEVLYAPEEEYNFRAAGVINPLDSVYYTQLTKKGITHLLLIMEVDAKQGDLWAYKTPYELALELNPYYYSNVGDNEYKTEVAAQLLSLRTKQFYSFTTKTHVNGVDINDKHGGRTNVNVGSMDKARNVAIKKAARRISKNCQ